MGKSKIYILLVIIILLIIGAVVYFEFNSNETVKVGATEFVLPAGYAANGVNSAGDLMISDKNNNSIYFKEYKTNNSESYMKNYVKNMNESNKPTSTSSFMIDDINVYKATNVNTSSNHYWFANNGKTYDIYSWEKVDNMDDIVTDLIKSIK